MVCIGIILPIAIGITVLPLLPLPNAKVRKAVLEVFFLQLLIENLLLFCRRKVDFRGTDRKYARDKAMAAVRRAIRSQSGSFTGDLEKEWFQQAIADIDVHQPRTLRGHLSDSPLVLWAVSVYEKMELVAVTCVRDVTESLAWSLGMKFLDYCATKIAVMRAAIQKERREVTRRTQLRNLERELIEELHAYGIKTSLPKPETTSTTLGDDARALLAMQQTEPVTDNKTIAVEEKIVVESSTSHDTKSQIPSSASESQPKFNNRCPEAVYFALYHESRKQKLEVEKGKMLDHVWSTARPQVPSSHTRAEVLAGFLSFEKEVATSDPSNAESGVVQSGAEKEEEMREVSKVAFAALDKEMTAIRAEKETEKGTGEMYKSSEEECPAERLECGVEPMQAKSWRELANGINERLDRILGEEKTEEKIKEVGENEWDDCSESVED
ncbi:hypothetical protein ONS95_006740 [Cadophora gregata]|uniref:uncharacterized protein n=1 Tax=Cadophora gregata TaxID=51156 RepID=UPI0026DD7976|nr:uncharacterized protein ONS95_006740 [Cadophora gregata]KAK0101576.1 hypothetical protein ONS95_006740 [Cadophora gregata]KAK0106411.1 hypothetical protein ONS96_004042 [Cadophora gregata f. sp. sojae]